MLKNGKGGCSANKPWLHYLYGFTIFILTLTGFGQMPIFKRYYIADIPGLGWLAQFYITHYMHYLGAIVFLGLAGYAVAGYLAYGKRSLTLTVSGYVRSGILACLAASGIFLVIRNLPGVLLPPGFIIVLDISHLGLVMLLLVVSATSAFRRWPWIVKKETLKEN